MWWPCFFAVAWTRLLTWLCARTRRKSAGIKPGSDGGGGGGGGKRQGRSTRRRVFFEMP